MFVSTTADMHETTSMRHSPMVLLTAQWHVGQGWGESTCSVPANTGEPGPKASQHLPGAMQPCLATTMPIQFLPIRSNPYLSASSALVASSNRRTWQTGGTNQNLGALLVDTCCMAH